MAIPKDGIVGYIIPLSSFTVPCVDMEDRLTHTPPPPTLPSSSSTYPQIDPKRNATDNTGCPMLCPSPPARHPEQNETWFALVRRGECDFITKAREVQRLGAKALIVGSLDESLLSMSSRGRSIVLPHPFTLRYSSPSSISRSAIGLRRRLVRRLHTCDIYYERRLLQHH